MSGERIIEDREETCSIVSKLVKIRIFRSQIESSAIHNSEGEIVGFECGSSSITCLSKCHYRMIMEDF